MIELGGEITLSGFKEVDAGSMKILKKIVGNYARRYTEILDGFENLTVSMKMVHKTENSEKFEIKGKVVGKGKVYNADITDRNIFVAVDSTLKAIKNSIQ